MIKTGDKNKRALSISMDEAMENPAKRIRLGETGATSLQRRMQQMSTERQVTNGDA